jgi:hypothetical protein
MTIQDTTLAAPEDTMAPEEHPAPGWVQVAVLGGDVYNVDHTEGQTVRQALEEAGVVREDGQVVTLNGTAVHDLDQPVEPGTVINVVSRVKNG